MKKIIILLIFAICTVPVVAQPVFFIFFPSPPAFSLDFDPFFSSPFSSISVNIQPSPVVKVSTIPILTTKPRESRAQGFVSIVKPQPLDLPTGNLQVIVNDDGFHPPSIILEANQSITWINERRKLSAVIMGVRELTSLKSDFLQPGDSFAYTFPKRGKYVYVDGIYVSYSGEVIVT
jgi:plastocyanin